MRFRRRPALVATFASSLLWLGVVSAQAPGAAETEDAPPADEAPFEGPAFGIGGLGSLDPCDLVTPLPRDGLPGTPEENGRAFFEAGKTVIERLGALA